MRAAQDDDIVVTADGSDLVSLNEANNAGVNERLRVRASSRAPRAARRLSAGQPPGAPPAAISGRPASHAREAESERERSFNRRATSAVVASCFCHGPHPRLSPPPPRPLRAAR
jgi:hypothetical protein